jgi:hypothetical protein
MHFASRLGLDQSSVRGIPATREDGRASLLAENAWLRARVAELEAALAAVNKPAAVNTDVNKEVNKPVNTGRNAYMRDYMRAQRAAKKNNPTP